MQLYTFVNIDNFKPNLSWLSFKIGLPKHPPNLGGSGEACVSIKPRKNAIFDVFVAENEVLAIYTHTLKTVTSLNKEARLLIFHLS